MSASNRRILIIGDQASIRSDLADILGAQAIGLTEREHDPSDGPAPGMELARFELGFAAQGLEGVVEARRALERGAPYAMAFVDVRLPPPALDGIETAIRLWEVDPRVEIALCPPDPDITWQQTLERLGRPSRFLVLGKPLESTGVRQAALALTEKWNLAREAERSDQDLEVLVRERTRDLQAANAHLRTQLVERLDLERRLQHAQKLEALGRLVAGVSHEISNPLSYVLSNLATVEAELSILEGRWGEAARSLREVIRDATAGGKQIQRIVRDLAAFSRRDQGLEEVRMEEVLRFALRVAQPFFPAESQVEQDYRPIPPVHGNAGLLSQVFVNLLSNAGRALAGVPPERRRVRVQVEPALDGRIRVTVRDHGVGIPEALLTSIFDPFFTTQPQGEGTGLGLYICHGILQRMGGEIRIESREREGTEAQVVLPLRPPTRALERPPTVGVLREIGAAGYVTGG